MVFGAEWEVKLKEKSWLLCCAETLRKLGFPPRQQHRRLLYLLTCGTLGSHGVFLEAGEVSP